MMHKRKWLAQAKTKPGTDLSASGIGLSIQDLGYHDYMPARGSKRMEIGLVMVCCDGSNQEDWSSRAARCNFNEVS